MSKRIGIAVIVLYLAFGFVLWEFNPQQWGANKRFSYCLLCGVSAAVVRINKSIEDYKNS